MLSRMPLDVGAFVAIDLETTGSQPGRNSIIEVGAARIEAGVVSETFQALVKPAEPVPPSVSHLTGITNEMLADAAPFAEVLEDLRRFVGGSVVVAHNYRFDLGFLDEAIERRWGFAVARPVLDTLAIARRLDPERSHYNLRELAVRCGASAPTHRAADDALATAQVFAAMVPRLIELGLRTAGDVAAFCGMALQSRLAVKLPLSLDVPDAPGVFLMRGEHREVIFVDRARNLRTSVRGHFYASSDGAPAQRALETVAVDCLVCPSELDAVLLESRLLQRYHPLHNHAGERGRKASIIYVDTGSPYPAIEVGEPRGADGIAFGPFTNRWAAETLAAGLRSEFQLRQCVRQLKEAPLEPCPHRDADDGCPRPCVTDVDQSEYQERLAGALGVFNGSADAMRVELETALVAAAEADDRERTAHYRDVLRALERCLSVLAIVRAEVERPPYAIVEGTGRAAVAHLIVGGVRKAVVRVDAASIARREHLPRLRRALERTLASPASADPLRLTRRQLKDLFLIRTYRDSRSPRTMPLDGSLEYLSDQIAAELSRIVGLTDSCDVAV